MKNKEDIHPIDAFTGQRLREARKAKNITQHLLASKLETPITFQQIQKYERGSNRLSTSKLWEFAQVLDVPPEFFFPPCSKQRPPFNSLEETQLVQLFRNLPDKKRSALLMLLQSEEV